VTAAPGADPAGGADPAAGRAEAGAEVTVVATEPAAALPLQLARAHRALPVGGHVRLQLRRRWPPERLADVLVGAGFDLDGVRLRTLPDFVDPGMRLLLCGLNPSLYAADAGVNFARPGNRFWPAMVAAGLTEVVRDPLHLLEHYHIGMTDLVKRATPRADELTADEYALGVGRVSRLCAWLRPGALCLVGLSGWRAAVDRRATTGWQRECLGRTPVYVMPNPSGLNAHAQIPDLAAHLVAASQS
jgi:TDG/mug DNA glycosylase family protein